MTTRRKPGQANIEEHPKGSGKYRVRARVHGKLRTIASGLTIAEAEELAASYTVVRNEKTLAEGLTLTQFGTGFLDRRERSGVRAIKKDRARWKRYIDKDAIGALVLSSLERRDVLDWLDRRSRKAVQTRRNALNLLRVALAEAVDRGILAANPARDVKVHRAGAATAEDELGGVLDPDEQRRLMAAIPEVSRPIVVFALLTGLRMAELWWLKPEDIGDGYITVRRSVGGKPPKNGRPRKVSLLAPAARALAMRPKNARWVWPAPRGGRRAEGKPPTGWHGWVKAAKIGRRIRWHDLRHTCATSLLAGWWGGPHDGKWLLDEVCEHMGHSSVKVTERYARKLASTTRAAALATKFPASSPLMLAPIAGAAEKAGRCGSDSNRRVTVLQGVSGPNDPAALPSAEFPSGNTYDSDDFAAAVVEHAERARAAALRIGSLPALVKIRLWERARARNVRVA